MVINSYLHLLRFLLIVKIRKNNVRYNNYTTERTLGNIFRKIKIQSPSIVNRSVIKHHVSSHQIRNHQITFRIHTSSELTRAQGSFDSVKVRIGN